MRVDIKVPFSCPALKIMQDVYITQVLSMNDPRKISLKILSEKYPRYDFGNIDFDNLPQDSYSINNNDITGAILINRVKYYFIQCMICAKNYRLHGLGYYLLTKKEMKRGSKSCGCGGRVNWTDYQNIVRLYDNIPEKDLFIGLVENKLEKQKTLVRTFCREHKNESNKLPTMFSVLNNNYNLCTACSSEYIGSLRRPDRLPELLLILRERSKEYGIKFDFGGWVSEYKNKYSKFYLVRNDGFETKPITVCDIYRNRIPTYEYGFSPSKPAIFYTNNDGNNNDKSGISNNTVESRLYQQNRSFLLEYGVCKLWTNKLCIFFNEQNGGYLAQELESIIHNAHNVGYVGCNSAYDRGDGYTETYVKNDEITVPLIIEFCKKHAGKFIIEHDEDGILTNV